LFGKIRGLTDWRSHAEGKIQYSRRRDVNRSWNELQLMQSASATGSRRHPIPRPRPRYEKQTRSTRYRISMKCCKVVAHIQSSLLSAAGSRTERTCTQDAAMRSACTSCPRPSTTRGRRPRQWRRSGIRTTGLRLQQLLPRLLTRPRRRPPTRPRARTTHPRTGSTWSGTETSLHQTVSELNVSPQFAERDDLFISLSASVAPF
jgi:hypothetical protein